MRAVIKLVLGAATSLVSFGNLVFGWFRAFDYLQRNAPQLFALVTSPTSEITLIVLGLVLAATGLRDVLTAKGRAYRIEVGVNSEEDAKKIHAEIVEAYIAAHPDPHVAAQLRSNVMPRELAEKVQAWLRPRLAQMGLSGPLRLVDLPKVPAPAAIRSTNSKNVLISGNIVEADVGVSGIDADNLQNARIKNNKVRVSNKP